MQKKYVTKAGGNEKVPQRYRVVVAHDEMPSQHSGIMLEVTLIRKQSRGPRR
jgi:hypothetical protein